MLQIWTRLRLPILSGTGNPPTSNRLLESKKRGPLQLSRSLAATGKWFVESAPGDPLNAGSDEKCEEKLAGRQQTASHGSLSSRRERAWERSLSPLERISHLIPPEFISPEVTDLKIACQEPGHVDDDDDDDANRSSSPIQISVKSEHLNRRNESVSEDTSHATYREATSQNLPFKAGEFFLAEFRKKYYMQFKKMGILSDAGNLNSNWGAISHKTIIGKLPGQMLRTSLGWEFLLRRPSLDEFVLMMKRGPTISYPKDVTAMLMTMDISPGNIVLEAGSGSGAMSLMLSRAVGSQGRVLSFELRDDHHRVAKKNYERWRTAWKVTHEEEWPDNVNFINKDIMSAAEDIRSVTFDAVALDMLNPQVALPTVFPCLKQGGVCSVYIANITQVTDLLEGIRTCQLSLLCENICEVVHRDWLVVPSEKKDGSISRRIKPEQNAVVYNQEQTKENKQAEEPHVDKVKPFGSVPYIARPYPWQSGHTAFLVKLRKFKPAYLHPEPEASDFSQGNDRA